MLNIDTKYLRSQYGVTLVNPCVHLRNFNKQHLILTKFYVSNTSSTGNQRTK